MTDSKQGEDRNEEIGNRGRSNDDVGDHLPQPTSLYRALMGIILFGCGVPLACLID